MKVDYEVSFRAYCEAAGVDMDELLERAGLHFKSPVITRRTEPLNEVELQVLFENEMQFEPWWAEP